MHNEDYDLVELKQGEYWRAIEAIPDQSIKKDMVLLLESIRDVDKTAHTIILRAHPSMYDHYVNYKYMQNGVEHTSSRHLTQHRFLVADFLKLFVRELNHEAIRRIEVENIQRRIGDLQTEIAEGDTGSLSVRAYLTHGMREWEKKKNLPAGSAAEIASTQMMALNMSMTPATVEAMKLAGEHKAHLATLKADWIKERVQTISETVKQMTPYFQEQAAAALSRTEDVIRYVNKLQKSIQSLDLYVGTGVTVTELRKGKSAPADIPLTIMQRRLYADEELSVYQDVTEDFDHVGVPEFLKALSKHAGLVNQLFGSERCVMAYAATRRQKDYGDAWSNTVRNKLNEHVGLLIRDGENLYAVNSPIDSHVYAHNLFPGKAELDKIFLKYRGSYSSFKMDDQNIDFMNVEYTDRLEQHEAFALHYKRFLILLAGLDHRLNLFGTFYEGEKSMDFISPEFQQDHFRFVHDDDMEMMLPEPNRLKLRDWINSKNSYLRSGARVLCLWLDVMDTKTAPGVVKDDNHSRHRSSYLVAHPKEKISVAIARREGREIIVSCPVKRDHYNDRGKEFDARVNLTAHDEGLGYLVLDAVNVQEMEYYINSRECRQNFLRYIKFFKLAVKHLKEEEAYEAEPRQNMRQALTDGCLATGTQADEVIDQTVIAWRAANRGASLPKKNLLGVLDQVKWTAVLNQMHVQLNSGSHLKAAEEFAVTIDRTPLRLVVTGKDRMVLYTAPLDFERDERMAPHVWVNAINIQRTKNGFKETGRKWTLLPEISASETTLHEWEGAKEWAGLTSTITFGEKQELFAKVMEFEEDFKDYMNPDDVEYRLSILRNKTRDLSKRGYVTTPEIIFPVGLACHRRDGKWYYVCAVNSAPYGMLYNAAQDDEMKKKVREAFVGWFANKSHAIDRFDRATRTGHNWSLRSMSVSSIKKGYLIVPHGGEGWLPHPKSEVTASLEAHIKILRETWDATEVNKDAYSSDKVTYFFPEHPIDALLGIDPRCKKFMVEHISFLHLKVTGKKFGSFLSIYPLLENGDAVGRKVEHANLKTPANGSIWSQNEGKFYTLEEAREFINEHYNAEQSTEEGAPNPVTEGVERWFIKVEEEKTDDA